MPTLSYGDILGNTQVGPFETVVPDATATSWISKAVPDAQIQVDWNQATSSAIDFIKNKPTIPTILARSFTTPSRSINTAFQISTSRDAAVSYSVDINTSVSLSGGAVGTVYLRYADDSAFTTNVVEVGRTVNGNTGTLVIGLVLTQSSTAQVNGIIPAGKYVKLVTENTTGTPTFTYRSAQEVLL